MVPDPSDLWGHHFSFSYFQWRQLILLHPTYFWSIKGFLTSTRSFPDHPSPSLMNKTPASWRLMALGFLTLPSFFPCFVRDQPPSQSPTYMKTLSFGSQSFHPIIQHQASLDSASQIFASTPLYVPHCHTHTLDIIIILICSTSEILTDILHFLIAYPVTLPFFLPLLICLLCCHL